MPQMTPIEMAQSDSPSTSTAIPPAKKRYVATGKLTQASLTASLRKGKAGGAAEEKTDQDADTGTAPTWVSNNT